MNVRKFARTVAREIRRDTEFWESLSDSVADRTVTRLMALPPLQRRAYTIKEAAVLLGLSQNAVRNSIQRGQLRSVDAGGKRIVPLTAIADLLGDELVLQYDGAMEVDVDLLSAIAIALVAEDVEAGRIEQDPEGPDWLILARELSKIRGVND